MYVVPVMTNRGPQFPFLALQNENLSGSNEGDVSVKSSSKLETSVPLHIGKLGNTDSIPSA